MLRRRGSSPKWWWYESVRERLRRGHRPLVRGRSGGGAEPRVRALWRCPVRLPAWGDQRRRTGRGRVPAGDDRGVGTARAVRPVAVVVADVDDDDRQVAGDRRVAPVTPGAIRGRSRRALGVRHQRRRGPGRALADRRPPGALAVRRARRPADAVL